MTSRLLNWLQGLFATFWLVPSLMALTAVGVSSGALALDAGPIGIKMANSLGWLWSGGAEGARTLLSTVASSMITVAGTVFSITIAALSLASSQFGPRLLRNFTRDVGNQIVLGTFIATYVYCLLVLRTVRGQSTGGFVPYLSVTGGILLAVASLGVLIYFIGHMANAIQAEKLIASVGAALKADIMRLCPIARSGTEPRDADADASDDTAPGTVAASRSGYIQTIDHGFLLECAEQDGLRIELLLRPGDFVTKGETLARIRPPDDGGGETSSERIGNAFSIGNVRKSSQDLRYGADQLTEIASRALSPGINDPYTAMGCVDWLADALIIMSRQQAPTRVRTGKDGEKRLFERPVTFSDLLSNSFDPLRGYAATNVTVVLHMLRSLGRLAAAVEDDEAGQAVERQAEQVAAAARDSLTLQADLAQVERELEQVRGARRREPSRQAA